MSPSTPVRPVKNKKELGDVVAEATIGAKPVVICVVTCNAQPCLSFAEKYDSVASDFQDEASFYLLDASANQETLEAARDVLEAYQLPTTVCYLSGREVHRHIGGGNKKLRWALAKVLELDSIHDSRLTYAHGRPKWTEFVLPRPSPSRSGALPESTPRDERSGPLSAV